MQLSVIIPCFNEERTIKEIISKVYNTLKKVSIDFEVVVIDDGSTDKSLEIISSINLPIVYATQVNQGKGRAVQTGISMARGRFVIIQDADLEYDPNDIPALFKLASENVAVYGSRMLDGNRKFSIPENYAFTSAVANIFFTSFHYLLYGNVITDTLTGYKLYPKFFFESSSVKTNGFETDHEITGLLIKKKISIVEVPISYIPRSRIDGKKIGLIDFFKAIKTMILVRFSK